MRDLAETYRTIAYAPSRDADMKRENANIDGESAMGAMLKYGSEGAKAFNLDEVLPEEFSKAHQEGWIHIHDLDFMTLTDTCCQIDVKKLLQKGFYTGHGFIRPPSNIKTAANLACIIIQSNQNDMHGGQSIPMLDFALAPYVAKSFVKNWRHEAEEMLTYREGKDPEDARHMAEQWSVKLEPRLGKPAEPTEGLGISSAMQIYERAEERTKNDTYQAMEALVHNLNTMQSRAGSQVPFSSVNYGTDTSPEGRLVSEMVMKATEAGLGEGETPIFPVQIFKLKDGVNYRPGDPNYDLFKLSIKVSAKRLYPNWESLDAPYNLQYYKAGDPDTEVATMGCYDGNQVATFRIGGRLFVEGAERFFDKMAMFHEVRECMHTSWIDVEGKGVEVYDSNANGFVGVKKLIRNPAPDDARLVKFDHGRSIVLTPDHMLPVEGRGRTAVRDLAVGDQVEGVWTQYSEVTQSIDHDMAWLLGLLLCDGCYASSVVASIGLDEADIRDKIIRVSKANGWDNRVKEYDRGPKGRYMDVHITTGSFKVIAKKLNYLFGGEKKADRCIPSDVFCWPKEARFAFLAGMMDADGCVLIHNGKTWFLNLGSVNEELAIQQMLLFQTLGVKAKIVRNHYKNVNAGAIRFAVYVNSTPELTQGLLRHMACKKKTDRMVNYEPMQDRTPFHLCTVESISKHRMSGWCYDIETESDRFDVSGIRSHNCRTRVMGNVYDPSRETTSGRGNLSFTTINLPRLGIEAHGDLDKFFADLDGMLDLCLRQLLFRLDIQKARRVRNYPFLMGEGVWMDSENLGWDEPVGDILNHGTLSIGFIGLAECLTALVGKHHGEDVAARELGLRIVTHMRHWMDRKSRELVKNVTCLAAPAEGLSGRFVAIDKKKYGEIKGITDRDYYTNSFHVPVWYNISAAKKVDIEAPYHALCNAGHITYIELDGDTARNLEAMESLVRYMHDKGCGYFAISHPVDRDPVCGYVGVINGVCPRCGRREGEAISEEKLEELKKKYKIR